MTQYKRAIGVVVVRTAAETKIMRVNFIRSLVEKNDAIVQPQESRYHGNYSNNS